MKRNYQRSHLRAPFRTDFLFAEDEYVFKGSTLNISEGGILLHELPFAPKKKIIPIMIGLADFPLFKDMPLADQKVFNVQSLRRKVYRLKIRIARKITEEGQSEAEAAFITGIGAEFQNIRPDIKLQVALYVSTSASNLIYLVKQMEEGLGDDEKLLTVRNLAHVLGYNTKQSISRLKAEVKHDYLSLQW